MLWALPSLLGRTRSSTLTTGIRISLVRKVGSWIGRGGQRSSLALRYGRVSPSLGTHLAHPSLIASRCPDSPRCLQLGRGGKSTWTHSRLKALAADSAMSFRFRLESVFQEPQSASLILNSNSSHMSWSRHLCGNVSQHPSIKGCIYYNAIRETSSSTTAMNTRRSPTTSAIIETSVPAWKLASIKKSTPA
ncbi:hypothetical protein BDY17DRAFT_303094 [Neohortaea acidophila]|uniref:Uncharacterized protein n=1 Tax=Neohortaea acidophila TaxID=245834 RepID=A0A6A6PKK2_9PEZI|nr:uncharacterized protein BDY17DRAFT_303094 [Neohortaea acidophila]KAF2480023.1 hypothetical protein BDY17DRAFT_303094 [Neohortaea acidophila]